MTEDTREWLRRIASGLNLDYFEDRGLFRFRLAIECSGMKFTALRRLVSLPVKSRETAIRYLADEYIGSAMVELDKRSLQ